ncbi:hypothetical protein LCGC14_1365630 [marine sediment metagenome]|uniref:Uncharacterized protein n=1 Tax=marine sediment metagenome TaxID=412755 RepID=A0A0F9K6X0_9ZZZZ
MSEHPISAGLWQKIRKVIAIIDGIVDKILSVTYTLSEGTVVADTVAGAPKIVTPASSGTANTYGSWVAVDASTSAASYISLVTVGCPARGATIDAAIDIGVSENAVITIPFNYFYRSDVGYLPTVVFPINPPIRVAASGAIDARITDNEANANTYRVGVTYHQA